MTCSSTETVLSYLPHYTRCNCSCIHWMVSCCYCCAMFGMCAGLWMIVSSAVLFAAFAITISWLVLAVTLCVRSVATFTLRIKLCLFSCLTRILVKRFIPAVNSLTFLCCLCSNGSALTCFPCPQAPPKSCPQSCPLSIKTPYSHPPATSQSPWTACCTQYSPAAQNHTPPATFPTPKLSFPTTPCCYSKQKPDPYSASDFCGRRKCLGWVLWCFGRKASVTIIAHMGTCLMAGCLRPK